MTDEEGKKGRSKVIPFNGITRLDLPPDRVLEGAMGELDSVVILGYDKEGEEYFASSIADGSDVVWLMRRAELKLLNVTEEDLL